MATPTNPYQSFIDALQAVRDNLDGANYTAARLKLIDAEIVLMMIPAEVKTGKQDTKFRNDLRALDEAITKAEIAATGGGMGVGFAKYVKVS